jgi:hypothetical protein
MAVQPFLNIVGSSFDDYVSTQLSKRADYLLSGAGGKGNEFRTPDQVEFLTNTNGWLRISSGVRLVTSKTFQNIIYTSDALAKSFILQGGVVYDKPGTNPRGTGILRTGFGNDRAYGIGFYDRSNGGGDDLGFRPMPGVTSFSITNEGPYGALRTANVNIKCYNLSQLDIIDTLYMRLGFSVFVEFGHIPYLQNNGVLQRNVLPVDFFNINDKETLIRNVAKRRRDTGGNYDGMLGVVSHFDWTANSDGSYDCQVKIMGPGSVVESLTINYGAKLKVNNNSDLPRLNIYQAVLAAQAQGAAPPTPPPAGTTGGTAGSTAPAGSATDGTATSATTATVAVNAGGVAGFFGATTQVQVTIPSVVATRNSSILHQKIYALYENAQLSSGQTINTGDGNWSLFATATPTLTNNLFKDSPYSFLNFGGGSFSGNDTAMRGNNAYYIKNKTANPGEAGKVPTISGNLFQYLVAPLRKSQGNQSPLPAASNAVPGQGQMTQVYIPLGYVMALLQASGLIYSRKEGDKKGTPYIYVDFNDSTNQCFGFPQTVSIDPDVCLVPLAGSQEECNLLFESGSAIEEDAVYKVESDKVRAKVQEKGLSYYQGNYACKLMNCLVNIEFIVNTLNNLAVGDEKREVPLDKFLFSLLRGINNATGGINEFRVAVDDEAFCIRLLDDQRIEGGGKIEPTQVNIIGLESTLQDYSYSAKITPKLSTQIVIAAQPGNTKAAGQDVSAFNTSKKDLIDRLKPVIVDSTQLGEGDVEPAPETKGKEGEAAGEKPEDPINQLSRHITNIYCKGQYNSDDVEGARNTLKNILLGIKSNRNNSKSTAAAVIPLEFNMKMMGISGVQVNQAFRIPNTRLPSGYLESDGSSRIAFIVRRVENAIENNRWVTSITGQTINLPQPLKDVALKSTTALKTRPAPPIPPPTVAPSADLTVTKGAITAADAGNYQKIASKIILEEEGGYYHPDMLKDGRVKDQRFGGSGETLYGIDRKTGGSENTGPDGIKFWQIIDSLSARTKWKNEYMPGPAERGPELFVLATNIIKIQYDKYVKSYLSAAVQARVNQDGRLYYHFVRAAWNGPGWFQGFAKRMDEALRQYPMITNDGLVNVAYNSRKNNANILSKGNKQNSLIEQGAKKYANAVGLVLT